MLLQFTAILPRNQTIVLALFFLTNFPKQIRQIEISLGTEIFPPPLPPPSSWTLNKVYAVKLLFGLDTPSFSTNDPLIQFIVQIHLIFYCF